MTKGASKGTAASVQSEKKAAPKSKANSSAKGTTTGESDESVRVSQQEKIKALREREAKEIESDWFNKEPIVDDDEDEGFSEEEEDDDESSNSVDEEKIGLNFGDMEYSDDEDEDDNDEEEDDDEDDEDEDEEEEIFEDTSDEDVEADSEDEEEDNEESSQEREDQSVTKSNKTSSTTKSSTTSNKQQRTPKQEKKKNDLTIYEQRDMEGEFASSDEEVERNATGDVPLEWYSKHFDHVGYDRAGNQIIPKGDGDEVSRALLARGESEESKQFRRSVYDARNDEVTVLTDRELLMVRRMLQGKFPHPEMDAEPEYIPYYSGVPFQTSLKAEHEPKSRFLPSKWERMKVEKIVRGIEEGKIRVRTKEEEEAELLNQDKPKLYMLWGEDGEVEDKDEMMRRRRRTGGHVPAPKMTLPGHAESYHPPPEYLLTDEEKEQYQKEGRFIPKDIVPMRRVGAYSDFVRERFERCLDLYLCARKQKVKLNIDPESLVPRLPLPRELRPFPTTNAVQYLGHTGKVRSTAVDPSGEILATGGDDGDVRLWDIESGRCLSSFRLQKGSEEDVPVVRIAWNPRAKGVVAAACGSEIHICFAGLPLTRGERNTEAVEALTKSLEVLGGVEAEERAEEEVEHEKKLLSWEVRSKIKSTQDLAAGSQASIIVIKLTGGDSVIDLSWHGKGDFLCSVAVSSTKTVARVLVHHIPKRRSQEAMRKLKGDPQAAVFHPEKPILFVATKTHVVVHHLTKQQAIKRLRAGVKWISSMAVHPKGDHLVIGSYDCRVVWFDLDLSSKPFKTMKYHTKAVRRVCFHKRYPLMASCSDDGKVNIFHTMVYDDYTRNPLIVPVKRIEAHDVVGGRGVLDAIFHPTQPWIFTAGADAMTVLFSNIP